MQIINACGPEPAYCSGSRRGAKIKFIVIHYTGVPGARGASMARRFARAELPENARKSSAHYVVDGERVWQAIPDERCAWHVGDGQPSWSYRECGGYDHAVEWHRKLAAGGLSFAGNRESIGIELCCMLLNPYDKGRVEDTSWAFTKGTQVTALALCAALCRKYDLSADRVIRHYDATGKPCPRPFVSLPGDNSGANDAAWAVFQLLLEKRLTGECHERE